MGLRSGRGESGDISRVGPRAGANKKHHVIHLLGIGDFGGSRNSLEGRPLMAEKYCPFSGRMINGCSGEEHEMVGSY